MDSTSGLRRRYDVERRPHVFDALPRWDDDGLKIGRGTRLARIGFGDLVDGDMKPGDFADAKGEEYARLLAIPRVGDQVMDKIVDVTRRHLRAAQALGANIKVYFAERDAADKVRERFARTDDLQGVVVGYLPPSKPKARGRSR